MPLELVGVRVEVPANTPMVLLREQTGRQRLLPIYIGTPGGDVDPLRPRGRDAAAAADPRPVHPDARPSSASRSQQIVVTEMRDHTYFAELHLRRAEGSVTVLSSRPSDAIALAVRCQAPLFASEELLDEVGQEPTPEPEEEAEEIIDEFRDFIEHVNPDDFAPLTCAPRRPLTGVRGRSVGCSQRRNYAGVAGV